MTRSNVVDALISLTEPTIKLEASGVDAPGTIAAMTVALEEQKLYVRFLDFMLNKTDAGDLPYTLKITAVGDLEDRQRIMDRVDSGSLLENPSRFVDRPSENSPIKESPASNLVDPHEVMLTLECWDQKYLSANVARIVARNQASFVHLRCETLNEGPVQGNVGWFKLRGLVRSRNVVWLNQLLWELRQWKDVTFGDDPHVGLTVTQLP